MLALWDTIFAYDPELDLIDLICVAMLLRIRWTLLEADYSVALQLMLKYPVPPPPHGPHTFVDDAIYLRDHPNAAGGVTLIFKYTGRSPTVSTPTPIPTARPSPPSFQGFGSLRQRTLGARSPLSTTAARLLQQPGGVEALFQGATKNMMERGEKLGINQAVRDAVGEIRRNMQGLQEARTPGRGRGTSFGDTRPTSASDYSSTLATMERRNRRLAAMLDESVNNLKLVATPGMEGDAKKHIEVIEVAAAKVQFVKACLEDSTITLPEEDLPPLGALSISNHSELRSPTVALDTTPVVMTSAVIDETRSALSSPEREPQKAGLATLPEEDHHDKMDTDIPEPNTKAQITTDPLSAETTNPLTPTAAPPAPAHRPPGPIPTRSTLAQSSFAWMLEPDTTLSSSHHAPASPSGRPSSSGNAAQQKKRQTASRERNAFLFGEVIAPEGAGAGGGERRPSEDEIFGLQPIRKVV